jgi:DinB family protein
MVTIWKKPNSSELTPYMKSYIELVPEGSLPEILEANLDNSLQFLKNITPDKLKSTYAIGKWTIPEIIVHIMDTERVFAYRLLRIARGDKTNLPGYEQDDYVKECYANERDFEEILQEYTNLRRSTISLLKGLSNKLLLRYGNANNMNVTVVQLAYMLTGHEIHHIKVIKEKYLNS